MKYAIIKNGKVENIVVATPEYAAQQGWAECPEGVNIGWNFDGSGEPLPPPPDTEGESSNVRAERNGKLLKSDVMVLPDRWSAMTQQQQQAWATYRQALRDIPTQPGFPWTIDWPEAP